MENKINSNAWQLPFILVAVFLVVLFILQTIVEKSVNLI